MARTFVAASSQKVQLDANPVSAYPFTLASWFYPTSLAAAGGWLLIGISVSGGAGYYGLTVANNTAIRAQIDSSFATATFATSATGLLATNQWFHVCGVFKSGTNGLRVYLNGTQRASSTNGETFPTVANFTAGGDPRGNSNFVTGRIAEVAVWNVELSDGEIAALATGAPPPRVRRSGLVLYWPLHGLVALEPDLSGHSRGGTVTGATKGDHAPVGPYPPPAAGGWR